SVASSLRDIIDSWHVGSFRDQRAAVFSFLAGAGLCINRCFLVCYCNLVPGGWHYAFGIFWIRSFELPVFVFTDANRFQPGPGELRAGTARTAAHRLGMGSTARIAVSDYGNFSIGYSCVLYNRDRYFIFLVERSLFGGAPSPLFQHNTFSS